LCAGSEITTIHQQKVYLDINQTTLHRISRGVHFIRYVSTVRTIISGNLGKWRKAL
jgi:hypothetical protein